jgi:2-polyprenyl-6-methoxyphenol hydroxylase-like FAD-dependent oxidoreductase
MIAHNRTTQASYTPIRHGGNWGYEWWGLEACDPSAGPPADLLAFVRELINAKPRQHQQRWENPDRPPRAIWSKEPTTLVSDAAHPTSPNAAYGAGMLIEDGYFPMRELSQVSLGDTGAVVGALKAFEVRRKPQTSKVTEGATTLEACTTMLPGPLRPICDLVCDHAPFLR